MRTAMRTRRGFTLIELLITIGLIALLVGLTVAGISKVRQSQNSSNTEQTVTKLQQAVNAKWTAIVDEANGQGKVPAAILAYCDNDMDRARSLWTYANLKRDLPQTFIEARSAINIAGIYTLQPRATFNSVPAVNSGDPQAEAAALLFLIVSEMANRGMAFAADDALTGAQTTIAVGTAGQFKVYKDAWGSPITFVRFFEHVELDSAPYVNTNVGVGLRDPLDPLGKLNNWGTLDPNYPGPPPQSKKQVAQTTLNQTGPGFLFDGRNKLITVNSAGQNKVWETDPTGTTDDTFGYRLRRMGKRGE